MASALINSASLIGRPQQAARTAGARRAAVVRAEPEDRQLDFSSNKRSGLGYLESDSAGQENIFAVEPKTYVQGTSADQTSTGLNAIIGVGAAAIAVAALASGLFAIGGPSGIDSVAPPAELKSLSQYSSEFRG